MNFLKKKKEASAMSSMATALPLRILAWIARLESSGRVLSARCTPVTVRAGLAAVAGPCLVVVGVAVVVGGAPMRTLLNASFTLFLSSSTMRASASLTAISSSANISLSVGMVSGSGVGV